MVNSGQGTNSDRPSGEIETDQQGRKQIAFGPSEPGEPSFFQNRKRHVNFQAGNSTPVGGGRADRRGIRDRVDGRDKEQQANQPDGIFEFQGVPKSQAATHPAGLSIKDSNIVHFMQEFRELFYDGIGSGLRPVAALPHVDRTSYPWAIAHSSDGLPRNPAKRAGKAERGGLL